ncbi:MAG: circularly permuted type 2 ATP-grasp protein [Planctomycetota bacterium]|nr:circularly permuted type 2 ATP-grasp protein [Planctomycetota bacterium]
MPATSTHQPSAWRAGYQGLPGSFDEMLAPDGSLRPHWHTFVSKLDNLGQAELTRRWEQARQLIHENGVTYNVYGDPRGMDRPWDLDSLPLLISAEDWKALEPALIQRMHLLNALLKDLYGAQMLLRAGAFPAELVFANQGFLRPCHGIRPPKDLYLSLYSADLTRLPGGQWSVIADRTQAPSGAGYALENRIVLSRVLPEIFGTCQVHRLAHFFQKMRQSLAAMAPHNRDNPRIVLLTPGPYNETYFEHAYLARYLNYILVEGGDLTVRDQCVYLKTLGGLQRVDLILRRLDADYCDPLELRSESTLGVPGLVQAVRAGNVAVANALGSGVVETPAINCFLPQLCRTLLNEDLKLPSVPTFWCGQKSSLQHALANLDKMVIKPVFPMREFEPVFGARLTEAEREELSARVRARPHLYVAQEQVALASVPALDGGQMQPRQAVLRSYLLAHDGSYTVMPGGLTQIPSSSNNLIFSLQRGSGSKDTWVLSNAPVSNFSLLHQDGRAIELSRGGSDLPSRVADNLFWLGRYVERAECAVRLMRGVIARLSERSDAGEDHVLPELLRALRYLRAGQHALAWDPEPELSGGDVLKFVMDESRSSGGLYDTLRCVQDVARMVRDRLSNDTWRVLRGLDEEVAWPAAEDTVTASELLDILNRIVIALASFGGLASESMTRSQLWRFLDIGRRLERANNMTGLLRSALVRVAKDEPPVLEAVLEVSDSLMTYRRRYLSSLQPAPVLDLLIADETNPRSLAFQLVALDEHVTHLPKDRAYPSLSPEQRLTMALCANVRLLEIDALARDDQGVRERLDETAVRVEKDMVALNEMITRGYLSHVLPSRQLASYGRGAE